MARTRRGACSGDAFDVMVSWFLYGARQSIESSEASGCRLPAYLTAGRLSLLCPYTGGEHPHAVSLRARLSSIHWARSPG
jgi:hypothetical protein